MTRVPLLHLSNMVVFSFTTYGWVTDRSDPFSAWPVAWEAGPPVLPPGPKGPFDEVSVKDPSLVHYNGQWHLFYSVLNNKGVSIGYVAAETLESLQAAPRHQLAQLHGPKSASYAAAPQVF